MKTRPSTISNRDRKVPATSHLEGSRRFPAAARVRAARPILSRILLTGVIVGSFSILCVAAAAESDAQGSEFFENKIRPVFVENCYKCHSAQAEKVKGGLLLDTRDGVLKGGDTGPAIVPGDPEKSLLIKAVRYLDEHLQMPPKDKKLAPEQIANLEAWVKMGAPDPRTGKPQTPDPRPQTQSHWAFQPVVRPPAPKVRNKNWVQTPIDAFVLAKLEEKKLSPSKPADKHTLIRRVTFDLTGLPPTPAEVDTFLRDKSPDAFAKVVDRLLASPQYGERWARHWLDVARYADTKGYVFEEERRYPYAYTYRDYVIRAFNEDLPFDRFIVEQLAADKLELGEDKRPLAAMGFLTVGRRFLNNQHDIIDDRIDVVSRGLMGLTVGCARCHDHKFDPIPTEDYYSLHGVFASSSEPNQKPLLGTRSLPKEYDAYLAERKKRDDELNSFIAEKHLEVRTQLRQRAGDYMLAALETDRLADKSKGEALARERKLDPQTVQRWVRSLKKWREQEGHSVFAPWFTFASFSTNEFAEKSEGYCTCGEAVGVNALVSGGLGPKTPASLKELAERYGKLFTEADQQWQEKLAKHQKSGTNSVAPTVLDDPALEELRQILYADDSPANVPEGDLVRMFDVPAAQKSRRLRRNLDELDATHPGSPPRGMVMVDNPNPTKPHVFVRGNPNNRGAEVPRRFLGVLAGEKRTPFSKGSGRLEFAEAIASRDNPLTARVLVNRVWLQYFGAGLVRTPSDFGVRSEPPTHPELLNWLATQFVDDGWSLKKLHRLIVLSSVYQQRSDDIARSAAVDSDNRLLWKMNRRRLDFEAMRDALLAIGGQLELTVGGHAVELTQPPFPARRTIYGFVERQNLPGLFRTFDFANPDATSPQRFATTVPQQALFMINSPFVAEQARRLVERPEVKTAGPGNDRVRALYRAVYQRDPRPEEVDVAVRFLRSQENIPPLEPERPAWQYGYGEYDDATKRVKAFIALPAHTNNAWQGGDKLPDEKLGWVMLNATGGHPGDLQHAAIRRWIAPRDLVIRISGTLGHEADQGDGVRGRSVSSEAGELGSWTARKSKAETRIARLEVKKGEAIDFVTDCWESLDSDSFTWAPIIKIVSDESQTSYGGVAEWNARADFSGPKETPKPLSYWERFAQVLLMSNELVFLD